MDRTTERLFDEYLAASARSGSRQAFDRLALRWQPRLYRHACRLVGDADVARDIVQEAWIEIFRGLPRLNDAAAFPAWAFRIVSRRCARWIRRRQSRRLMEAAYVAEQSIPQETEGDPVDDGRIARALAALPPDQRATIALFYLEGFRVAEIAAALDVPAGTVKTRLMHARRKLRAALEGEQT